MIQLILAILTRGVSTPIVPPPPTEVARTTESGEDRITEDGETRIIE